MVRTQVVQKFNNIYIQKSLLSYTLYKIKKRKSTKHGIWRFFPSCNTRGQDSNVKPKWTSNKGFRVSKVKKHNKGFQIQTLYYQLTKKLGNLANSLTLLLEFKFNGGRFKRYSIMGHGWGPN